jgi:F0F1-type ATP synthase membrane subunit a
MLISINRACVKASGSLGTTLGLGVVALLRYTISSDDMQSWGEYIHTYIYTNKHYIYHH